MIEEMVTRMVLEDGFTRVLNRVSAAQDAYARRTNAMNVGGNLFLAAGAGVGAFLIKSVQVAGQLDEIKKSMAAVEGANRAAFSMDFVDKWAQHSKFTYLDLANTAKTLGIQGQSVAQNLPSIASIAASSGKDISRIAQLYDAVLAGQRVGLGLSARGGFSQYGLAAKKLFDGAGVEYNPKNLQNSMTPHQLMDAVVALLKKEGKFGLDQKLATTTLSGAEGMVQDAMTRIFNNVMAGKNETSVIDLLGNVAARLNAIANAAAKVPDLGKKLFDIGGATVLIGAILKGQAAWRDYRNMVNLATIASNTEQKAEVDKTAVAVTEGRAIGVTAGEFGTLTKETNGAKLATIEASSKAVTAGGKWGVLDKALGGVIGKFKGIIKYAALAAAAAVAVDAAQELAGMGDKATHDNEQFASDYEAFRRNRGQSLVNSVFQNPGRTLTYGWKSSTGQGTFERMQAEAQRIIGRDKSPEGMAAFARSKPAIDDIIRNWGKTDNDVIIQMAEHLKTLVGNADKYAQAGGDIAAGALEDAAADKQQRAEENVDAARARRRAAIKELQRNAASPTAPDDLALDNAATMMRIAELDYNADKGKGGGGGHDWTGRGKGRTVFGHMKAGEAGGDTGKAIADMARFNQLKQQALALADRDIASWERLAAGIEKAGGHNRKYFEAETRILALKEKRAEIQDKKLGQGEGSATDRTIAAIISAGGVNEDSVIKMGLNRRLFSEMTNGMAKGNLPQDRTRANILAAAKRPLVVNFSLDGKVRQTFKGEVADEVMRQILAATMGVNHTLPGGKN